MLMAMRSCVGATTMAQDQQIITAKGHGVVKSSTKSLGETVSSS